jgi:hypothetical protein
LIYHDHKIDSFESTISDRNQNQHNIIAVFVSMFHLDLGEGHMNDLLTTDFHFEFDKSSIDAYLDLGVFLKFQELQEINHSDNFYNANTISISSDYADKISLRGPPR